MLNFKARAFANALLRRCLSATATTLRCEFSFAKAKWRGVSIFSSTQQQQTATNCDRCNFPWLALSGASVLLGIGVKKVVGEEQASDGSSNGFDYTLIISNEHTAQWRIFTNRGKELFSEGKLDEAEQYFLLALEEAKKGFGELDPHVASAYHNLGELYRMKRMFEKAEPFYIQALNLLETLLGPEDVRVGFALHNLGGFYQMQNKLELAQSCYERALKIKKRVLGLNHPDYANTMFRLGEVLRLQGVIDDAELLVQDSIRILEEGKLAQSQLTIKRMAHLAQMLLDSNKLHDAENLQRRILHILEVTKGWNSLNTVAAAEQLAMTIQLLGNIDEARDLLRRCLQWRKNNQKENDMQVGKAMLKLAKAYILKAKENVVRNKSEARNELEAAKSLIKDVVRICDVNMLSLHDDNNNDQSISILLTMMQCFDELGTLENTILQLESKQSTKEENSQVEKALRKCVSAFKRPENPQWMVESEPIKRQYLNCLGRLAELLRLKEKRKQVGAKQELRQLNNEIRQLEHALASSSKQASAQRTR